METLEKNVTIEKRGFKTEIMKKISAKTEEFWQNEWYFISLFALAALCIILNQHVIGAAIFALAASYFMAFCPDFMASIMPILVITVLVGAKYETLNVFVPLIGLVVPFIIALIVHSVVWPVKIVVGRSARGLALVSIATLLGGINVISKEEYFSMPSIYNMLGLGIGLLLLYVILRSNIEENKIYDLCRRFAIIFYIMGILMALVIFMHYVQNWQEYLEEGHLLFIKYRNYAATILLTTLPITFYFMVENRWHLMGGAFILLAMVMTGSRSALVFGIVELVIGCAYLVHYGTISKRTMVLFFAMGGAFMLLFGVQFFQVLYSERLIDGQLITANETRWKQLARGISDFIQNPIFGKGLGNLSNKDLMKALVPGSMFYYHNIVMQIIGSMGIVGIGAYGVLFYDRVRLLIKRLNKFTIALGLSYMGMLLVSLTNPGEFCPLPNAALMVILFTVLEVANNEKAIPIKEIFTRKNKGAK